MGCGSRFWVGWAGVLGQSLVDFGWLVEFGSAFYSLFFLFYFFIFKVALVDVGLCR